MTNPCRLWLTFREACQYSRLNHHKVRRLLRNGEVYGRKIGRTWTISKESIDDYLFAEGYVAAKIVGELLEDPRNPKTK